MNLNHAYKFNRGLITTPPPSKVKNKTEEGVVPNTPSLIKEGVL